MILSNFKSNQIKYRMSAASNARIVYLDCRPAAILASVMMPWVIIMIGHIVDSMCRSSVLTGMPCLGLE